MQRGRAAPSAVSQETSQRETAGGHRSSGGAPSLLRNPSRAEMDASPHLRHRTGEVTVTQAAQHGVYCCKGFARRGSAPQAARFAAPTTGLKKVRTRSTEH